MKASSLLWAGVALSGMTGGYAVVAVLSLFAQPSAEPDVFTTALNSVSGNRMLADVVRLSADEFNGRQAGTADDLRSGLFVAERFELLGLKPAPLVAKPLNLVVKDWAIAEPIMVNRIDESPSLELFSGKTSTPAKLGSDYLPILDSPTVVAKAPVIFVGYGISDPQRGIDDYAGINVQNRVVLFFRGKPEHLTSLITQAEKERTAREKGAAAYLTVTGPILSAYEARRGLPTVPMASYSLSQEDRRLAGAWISTALAEKIVSASQHSLRQLQEQLNRSPVRQSFATGMTAELSWKSWQTPAAFYNFLAVVPGSDRTRRHEVVLIGAHRDHFGRPGGLLFAGADDNASGTAVLLEVARKLSRLRPKRSVAFVSFSGEELSLAGSRFYVRQPPWPLPVTRVMINVDHAGVGNGRLTVGVTGLAKKTVLDAGKTAGLGDRLDLFGFFPGGDHVPFKEADVPTVTIVSGGPHPDFHQPSDKADKVKPDILAATAKFVLALAWQLANAP